MARRDTALKGGPAADRHDPVGRDVSGGEGCASRRRHVLSQHVALRGHCGGFHPRAVADRRSQGAEFRRKVPTRLPFRRDRLRGVQPVGLRWPRSHAGGARCDHHGDAAHDRGAGPLAVAGASPAAHHADLHRGRLRRRVPRRDARAARQPLHRGRMGRPADRAECGELGRLHTGGGEFPGLVATAVYGADLSDG